MAKSFLLTRDALSGDEVAIYSIAIYESVDGSTGWTKVETVLVSSFTTDPSSGKDICVSAIANDAYYHVLIPVAASGLEGPFEGGAIIPPDPAGTNSTLIFVNSKDILGQDIEGIELMVKPANGNTVVGNIVVDNGLERVDTDSAGYASLAVVRGSKVTVTFGDHKSLTMDTSGLPIIDLSLLY